MATTKKYVSLEKLGLYDEKIKKVITDGDAAALASAKSYADGLASNYDAAGSASTALESAKSYADGKDAAIQAAQKAADDAAAAAGVADGKAVAAQNDVDALETYVGTFTHDTAKSVVEYINAKTDGIATSGNLEALGTRVTTVEGKVATIEANYLDGEDKTELEGKITAAQNAADAAQGAVNTLSGTHATDKKALEDAIALKADQTALDGVSAVANAAVKQSDYNTKVEALEAEDERIAGLVASEAERAAGAEEALGERLEEVEAFFKLAEGESLDAALDTLKEIQTYITSEGAAADQMVLDIAANKKAIEDHVATDHDFASADATLKEELNGEIAKKADKTTVEGIDGRVTTAEGKITTVEGKVSTLEGQMTTVQGAVATKAEAQALTDAVSALEQADTGLGNRIAALEGKFTGDGSVEDMIATAKQEAIDAAAGDATSKANAAEAAAKSYTDGEIDKVEATISTLTETVGTKAAQSEVNTISGKVGTLETKVGTLETEMDAVEAKAAANESAISTLNTTVSGKASQTDLDGVSGRVTTLETWHSNFVECSQEDINNLFV